MTQRTKLELAINLPTELTLLYSEPITGRSQYGDYYMYAVAVGEDEYSFFAPAEVHAELSKLGKGNKAVVTKLAAQRGSKLVTTYDVKVVGKEVKQQVAQTEMQNQEDVYAPASPHDSFFDVMLNSYRDALEISRELNGLVDVHRCSITLYLSRCRHNNY